MKKGKQFKKNRDKSKKKGKKLAMVKNRRKANWVQNKVFKSH